MTFLNNFYIFYRINNCQHVICHSHIQINEHNLVNHYRYIRMSTKVYDILFLTLRLREKSLTL